MGLLDELKKKADKVRADGQADLSASAQRQAYYENNLKPAMEQTVAFLQEFLEQLQVLEPKVFAYFQVPGYAKPGVKALQSLPAINLDSTLNTKVILLRFASEAKNLEFSVTPATDADDTRKFLTKVGQQFSDWPIRSADGAIEGLRFAIASFSVPAFLRFEANIEQSCVVLKSTNVRDFGYKEEQIKAEDITAEWLDHFGRFMLGEADSPVHKYTGDVDRQRLQKMVDQDRAKRESELAKAEQELRDKAEAAKLSSRINRAIDNVRQRLPKVNTDDQ